MERFAREGALTYSNFEGSWFLISPRCGTDDQWFPDVIVIVLGFQVAVVNISEKLLNLNRRMTGMRKIGTVPTDRVHCMRKTGCAGSLNGRFYSRIFP